MPDEEVLETTETTPTVTFLSADGEPEINENFRRIKQYVDDKTEGGDTPTPTPGTSGVVYNAQFSVEYDESENLVFTVESVKKGEDDVDWGTITEDLGTAYGECDLTVVGKIYDESESIDEYATLRLAGLDNSSNTIWFATGYILSGVFVVISLEGVKDDSTDEITWTLTNVQFGGSGE